MGLESFSSIENDDSKLPNDPQEYVEASEDARRSIQGEVVEEREEDSESSDIESVNQEHHESTVTPGTDDEKKPVKPQGLTNAGMRSMQGF